MNSIHYMSVKWPYYPDKQKRFETGCKLIVDDIPYSHCVRYIESCAGSGFYEINNKKVKGSIIIAKELLDKQRYTTHHYYFFMEKHKPSFHALSFNYPSYFNIDGRNEHKFEFFNKDKSKILDVIKNSNLNKFNSGILPIHNIIYDDQYKIPEYNDVFKVHKHLINSRFTHYIVSANGGKRGRTKNEAIEKWMKFYNDFKIDNPDFHQLITVKSEAYAQWNFLIFTDSPSLKSSLIRSNEYIELDENIINVKFG